MLQELPAEEEVDQTEDSCLEFRLASSTPVSTALTKPSVDVRMYRHFRAFSDDSFSLRHGKDNLSSISSVWVSRVPNSRAILRHKDCTK